MAAAAGARARGGGVVLTTPPLTRYDDLFLLRYILSAKGKDMPKCAESVRTGLKWRADNEEVVLCARKLGTLVRPGVPTLSIRLQR